MKDSEILEGPHLPMLAVMVFNVDGFSDADDKLRRCEKRGMNVVEAVCVVHEMVARLTHAVGIKGATRAEQEKHVNEFLSLCAKRAIGMLDLKGPGQGPEAEDAN